LRAGVCMASVTLAEARLQHDTALCDVMYVVHFLGAPRFPAYVAWSVCTGGVVVGSCGIPLQRAGGAAVQHVWPTGCCWDRYHSGRKRL